MIQHVVMMTFKAGTDQDRVAELEKLLGALPGVIEEIRSYDFGRDVLHSQRSFDFALVSAFDDLAAMDRYQQHPRHQEVLQFIGQICDRVHVVDFETKP